MATDFDRDDRLQGLLRNTLRSQPASGACVDAATLAAWAEDALTPEETAATDAHLATCARCRDLAATLSTMAEEETPAASVVAFTPRANGRWKVIVGAMGAVAASALIWVAVREGSPSIDTTSAADRPEQSQARGMGGNVPSPDPAPLLGAQDSSARQQRADVARETERRQGQQGQAASAPRPEARLARENTTRAAQPSPSVKPTPAPVEPPARTAASPPPAVMAPPPAAATAPPPPPPAPLPAATAGAARSSTVAGLPQSTININLDGIKPADPRQGGFFTMPPILAEFVAGADLPAQQGQGFGAAAAGGRAGGAGRGGGGGGGAAGAGGGRAAGSTVVGSATAPVRWRLREASPSPPSMATLERSSDAGATWQQVPIPVLTTPLLTAGTAPTNSVCWLVGRTGIVLLSTDGTTFRQVTKPVDADLLSVLATDARSATVRTADGRTFTTTDGGLTWTPRSGGPSHEE